jgi:hypothetical protein
MHHAREPIDRRCVPYIRQTLAMRGIWKWVGLAGVAGVVAGGVLVARDQRRRNSYTPEDIRVRLHQRVAEAGNLNN